MKAIFTHKPQSIYDDLPWERYHFPRTYLRQVEDAVGDLVLYYEPRREGVGDAVYRGRQAYVALARVETVRPDPARPDHFYADMADYLQFAHPVPFKHGAAYFESGLRKQDGSTNRGLFGRAVRSVPPAEFDAIVQAGFIDHTSLPADHLSIPSGLAEPPPPPFAIEGDPILTQRPTAERVLSSRAFRDRAFAAMVGRAYDGTCALTGLRLVNGGGRTEAEAAHIKPVAERGPDTVRNGLALSGTVHWMFDRGLVSIAPDRTILVASSGVPDQLRGLFHADGKARFPLQPWLQPASTFLDYHRQTFKG